MRLVRNKKKLKNKRILEISFLSSLILILFLIQLANISPLLSPKKILGESQNPTMFNDELKSTASDRILFQGNEIPLNITEYANLYNNSQEITLNNEQELNLTYYLGEDYGWKVSKIKNSIKDIQDNRNWVNGSDFLPITVFNNKSVSIDATHGLPSGWESQGTISHPGAYAMRLHFESMTLEKNQDYIWIENKTGGTRFFDTGNKNDFFTPWIKSNKLKIWLYSDGGAPWSNCKIDYYEFVNASSNYYINNQTWGFNEDTISGSESGSGFAENISAMYLALFSDVYSGIYSHYGKYNFTEIYQNLTIPRSKIKNAFISFDYYPEFCMESNNLLIDVAINNKKIYSIYFGDIYTSGLNQWHSTGKIYMPLWSNNSNIFEGNLIDQDLNISIGLRSVSDVYYSGYKDGFQQMIWFDNVTLGITSLANSTQEGIDLKINREILDNGNEWGQASQVISSNIWEENPVILNVSTTASELYFELDTTLYGYHNTTTKFNRNYDEGVSYTILQNGSVYWEFLHDFAKIEHYSDFEFIIYKPKNWKILSAKDQGGNFRPFEGGRAGDNYLKINKSHSIIGWWTFEATSPNFLNISNTKTYKSEQWVQSSFKSGESVNIRTQVNYSNEIPNNIKLTFVYLTIYHPNGTIWYEDSKSPDVSGKVTFPKITIGSYNTTGGIYNYTLFWSNGTALGGLKSSFIIIHNSSMTLLRPTDAVNDLITDAYVGDIIPLKIQLKDSENNLSISNALISYNWTGNIKYLEHAASGIYEGILDTLDLGSNGFYKIIINSTVLGFSEYDLTLEIVLAKETTLQRLESDYSIEIHANSTIKFRYSILEGEGISNAEVQVNISNPALYTILDLTDGYYEIEFDTSYITDLGIYQLSFNFSSPTYELQKHIYQFEIIEQSVNLTLLINSQEIEENSIYEVMFKEEIKVSVRVFALIDYIYLSGGNVTWIGENHQINLTEYVNFWFNGSIVISATYYNPGLNFVYIKFNQEKYRVETFGFQLLVREQEVNLSVYINSVEIFEHSLIELNFKESINVSARAFATAEKVFLSGGSITWFSEGFEKNLTQYEEMWGSWFNSSIVIDGAYFYPGINYVYLKFQQENYTIETFSFQLFIREQHVNLSVYINSVIIVENSLIEVDFKESFNISVRAFATVEKKFLSGGSITWFSEGFEKNLTEYKEMWGSWFNISVICSPINFSLGINYIYIQFEQDNYTTISFAFQLKVNQISIDVKTIDFEGSFDAYIGEDISIEIQLKETGSNIYIDGASVSYSWEYGVGTLDGKGNGIYELELEIPDDVEADNYKVTLIISKEGSEYKSMEFSFILDISEEEVEEDPLLFWIIVLVLIAVIGVLAVLSYRSYVLLPRKRRRESDLLARTQRFKDLQNIQAVVIIHKSGGVPVFLKSYSILEHQKKELFSGFIQAITTIGEELSGKERVVSEEADLKKEERVLEIDFKHFHCLIADKGDIRAIFILRDKSSERLRKLVKDFSLYLHSKLKDRFATWDGSLDEFERNIPPILNKYFELFYKEPCKLAKPEIIANIRKENELNSMELRILNVIYSLLKGKGKSEFYLATILELVHEENKDLIIDSIETLIERKIIIASTNNGTYK